MKVVMYTTFRNVREYQRGEEIQVWNKELKRKGDIEVIIDLDEILLDNEPTIDELFHVKRKM